MDVRAAQLDVSNIDSVAAFRASVEDEPTIDALVNNAGASFDAEVAALTLEGNYRGAVGLTDAADCLVTEPALRAR